MQGRTDQAIADEQVSHRARFARRTTPRWRSAWRRRTIEPVRLVESSIFQSRVRGPLPVSTECGKKAGEVAAQETTVSTGRCDWGDRGGELYVEYHDTEWGVPVHDDHKQFEFLILEGAQAGLSWLIVLKKREAYRKAFANFDPAKVARFSEQKIETLIQNPGIIRNRLKIRAAVGNARAFLEIQKEFGSFDAYIWGFVGGKPIQNRWQTMSDIPATSAQSNALSQDLKKRGFKFVGSTIMYAHLQAAGMVNDHLVRCFRHRECAALAI